MLSGWTIITHAKSFRLVFQDFGGVEAQCGLEFDSGTDEVNAGLIGVVCTIAHFDREW